MMKPFTLTFLLLLVLVAGGVCRAQTPTRSPAKQAAAKTAADAADKYFPNAVLVTQDNRKVKFYDDLLKDKIVVINFMFTTCTSICPPMTANLRKVQTLLGDRSNQVNMISISVDPQTDTPERLKAYAERFKAQPGWYFLTGEKANVDLVLQKLGGYVADKSEHSPVLLLGNVGTGEWKKMYSLARAQEIATQINQMLDAAIAAKNTE